MAPETAIGAASPVGSQGADLPTTEQTKVKEAMKALVRSYTERRGAEATALAESTIESAKAVSATEALQVGLVDFIANDLNDLLNQLDGYTVQMSGGSHILHTAGAMPQTLEMSFIERLLQLLVDPNFVLILLSIGVQAILIELSSPGGWVAGFIGVVCLALAAYGLGVLPVNWFGLAFLIIAFVLFIVDIKAATHGGLTVAGIGAFIVGALVLFNSPGTPQFQRVSLPLVIAIAIIAEETGHHRAGGDAQPDRHCPYRHQSFGTSTIWSRVVDGGIGGGSRQDPQGGESQSGQSGRLEVESKKRMNLLGAAWHGIPIRDIIYMI
jgi:membrane-bound serine protease (ClpP class)